MEKFDFLRKDLVRTFTYSTITQNRESSIDYIENGRRYTKYGTLQALTYVGLLYKVYDTKAKLYKYIMHIGISKQHPCDLKINKDMAYEEAYLCALLEPVVTYTFDQKPTSYDCMDVIYLYNSTVKVRLVKTKQEIKQMLNK